MNITEGSANNWLHVRSNNNETNSSSNTTSNNNIQGNLTAQVWDLRWFALLSGPLLFGTIILPLITGPAIQYLCHSYVTLRVYWRLGFVFLAVAYLVLFYSLAYSGAYSGNDEYGFVAFTLEMICDSTFSIFVCYQVFIAWRFKKRRWVWNCCLVLVLLVWLLDLGVIYTGHVSISFGVFGWIIILLALLIIYRREAIAKGRVDTRVS